MKVEEFKRKRNKEGRRLLAWRAAHYDEFGVAYIEGTGGGLFFEIRTYPGFAFEDQSNLPIARVVLNDCGFATTYIKEHPNEEESPTPKSEKTFPQNGEFKRIKHAVEFCENWYFSYLKELENGS